jgi:hypothetical protein
MDFSVWNLLRALVRSAARNPAPATTNVCGVPLFGGASDSFFAPLVLVLLGAANRSRNGAMLSVVRGSS